MYKYFTSLAEIIPKFYFSGAIINRIVLLIPSWIVNSCVEMQLIFCMLNLYPKICLICLLVLMGLFCGIFGVSYTNDHVVYKHRFSVLPFQLGCFSFFLLIALARTFSTILKRSGKNRHPCIVSDIREKASISHY